MPCTAAGRPLTQARGLSAACGGTQGPYPYRCSCVTSGLAIPAAHQGRCAGASWLRERRQAGHGRRHPPVPRGAAPLVGLVTVSPFSYDYRGVALTAGPHTVTAIQCSTDGAVCLGPQGSQTFTADVLHPIILAGSPSPFSPNGYRYKDATTITFSLPETQAAWLSFVTSTGAVARSVRFGTLAPGRRSWTWNGRSNSGARLADGIYTVNLTTSKVLTGVTVPGLAIRSVRIDNTRPALGAVTGNGTTFYPTRDGYRDWFTPRSPRTRPPRSP